MKGGDEGAKANEEAVLHNDKSDGDSQEKHSARSDLTPVLPGREETRAD